MRSTAATRVARCRVSYFRMALRSCARSPATASVNPHKRGDDVFDSGDSVRDCGSPPRAWGRPLARVPRTRVVRFTPTCVGTTSWSGLNCRISFGSPPRAWGRRLGRLNDLTWRRFTPTCVGTTSCSRASASSRFTPTCVGTTVPCAPSSQRGAVHPHVRGDDGKTCRTATCWSGSPPRAWGRHDRPHAHVRRERFTPTCVGTTTTSPAPSAPSPVHPHVRGDDVFARTSGRCMAGSPPRAWGRHVLQGRDRIWRRFTPTCVGTTCSSSLDDGQNMSGSPPRAWGRLVVRRALGDRARFTPTCVGTTCRVPARLGQTSVHPHVRGDDLRCMRRTKACSGSPPRAWGRRGLRRLGHALSRFTPTCVGTTHAQPPPLWRFTVHPHVRGDDG